MKELKYCKHCNQELPLECFRHNRCKCKECEKLHGRTYRQSDSGKQKAKEWSNNNKEKHKKLQSEWTKKNRSHINNKFNQRWKNDFEFKIKKSCQKHLMNNLKSKQKSTMKYFSCDIKLFIEWLEYCFTENMTINNHGTLWHLDHVIPVSSFDLKNPEEVYLCFHYLNYMPITATDNLSKNNKIIYSQLLTHSDNIFNFHIKNDLKIDKKYFQLLARHLKSSGNSLEF
jgi:hypothetical protein